MTNASDPHLETALKWLDRAALSRKQAVGKMRRAGWDETESQRVADRLAAVGAIDDEAMARSLIEELRSRRHAGPMLLRAKLRQRGLDANLVERLIEETINRNDTDLVADATALARKRLRSLERFDLVTKKRRLWSLLARRGFDSDTVERALASLSELHENNDPI